MLRGYRVTRKSTWDGVERRSGKDRRQNGDRRTSSRTLFERRSGLDRRGHKLYSAVVETGSAPPTVTAETVGDPT
jgi:hypothetical protein